MDTWISSVRLFNGLFLYKEEIIVSEDMHKSDEIEKNGLKEKYVCERECDNHKNFARCSIAG